MGIISSNKKINVDTMKCDGTARVSLAITAAPDILENPADIVLVLDHSGSMSGTPLASMKEGAKTFIDIIDEATDGNKDGQIGSGSRIGIVSFSDTATVNAPLITSVADLKSAVDSLVAGGSTNHADAFFQASQLFTIPSSSQKVIVMFTDGKTTSGSPPLPVAEAAKASGIVIYCIGLIGSDGIDVSVLNAWASDPDATHVAVTPDAADLEELFAELAANISKTGATNIRIDEVLNSDFSITDIGQPNKGTVSMSDPQTIIWTIPELGVSTTESALLDFGIRHITNTAGLKKVNQSITYTDNEGNVVIFPDPSVMVDCDIVIYPEECPEPVDLSVDNCRDASIVDLGETYMESLGRIVEVSATIKNICPGKRVAAAIILTETDEEGMEYQRGMKTFTIPSHDGPGCRDVQLKCIKFVLPEDLNPDEHPEGSICTKRNLKARVIANQLDTDYRCCESVVTL